MTDIPEERDATLPVSAEIVPFPIPPDSPIQLISAAREMGEVLGARIDDQIRRIERIDRALSAYLIGSVAELKELHAKKFRSVEATIIANRTAVEDRFQLLTERTKAAAVDAAFAGIRQLNQANFLASQKQEAAFAKHTDQLAASVVQISKAHDDTINELKNRLVAMERRSSIPDPTTAAALRDMASAISTLKQSRDEGSGGRQQKADSTAWIFSAIAAAVAIGMMAIEMFRTAH
jgi:hypothetical protein